MTVVETTSSTARDLQTRCCIVGGGPAGMMLGYLLARAGVRTVVIEKHADFLRDFRGDTVHPSTMQIMHELGLLREFLERPHHKTSRFGGSFGRKKLLLADFSRLSIIAPFVMMMPQWEFLNFIAEKASAFDEFRLVRSTAAVDIVRDGERVAGVVARDTDGEYRISADLTVGCDGRQSIIRERAGLRVKDIGAPIDVLWFRITKSDAAVPSAFMHAEAGGFLVTIDRGEYWQCAFSIAKGEIERVHARGLPAFKSHIVEIVPALAGHISDIKSWDDVKLLNVSIDRLEEWAIPGLLCIGDAAHAMSPVGGAGINLAIQDAVAAANALADKLLRNTVTLKDLNAIQRRREFPVKVIQAIQQRAQNGITVAALNGRMTAPLFLRMVDRSKILQGLFARLFGVGVRPEHVHTPTLSRGA